MAKPKLQIIVKKQYLLQGVDLIKGREEAGGLSQEELAEKVKSTLGTQQNISNIESSLLLHQIKTQTVKALQEVFDVHFKEYSL